MKEIDFTDAMNQAISHSLLARNQGEDPFGAVLLDRDGNIVSFAHSTCIHDADPTAHAEMNVIRQYCTANQELYLKGFTIVSSAEPCVMCSGAIKWAKISKVVFGVSQIQIQKISGGKPKPSCDSILNTGSTKVEIIGNFLSEKAIEVLNDFVFIPKDQTKKNNQS